MHLKSVINRRFSSSVALLFTILPTLSFALRTPTISYITQEQIKDIGGTVELKCGVQFAEEYSVNWVKIGSYGTVFLSTGSTMVLKDSRFSLRHDQTSTTYTLQIKDLQETDAGQYQCEVVLSVSNKVTGEVLLSVRRPPIISDNSTQSIVATEGQAVQMECFAGGYPTPTITWRRENNAILPTGKKNFISLLCLFFLSNLFNEISTKLTKIVNMVS